MNSFDSKATLGSGNRTYTIYRLPALEARGFNLDRLPFSLKILLENLLRREDGVNVTAGDIEFLANWSAKAEPSREIAYMPARVLMQDFTGVPAVVDLAAMRDAIKTLGGDPERVNPLVPAAAGDRSLCAGGRVRHGGGLRREHIVGVSAQSGAVCILEVGTDGISQLLGRSAGNGNLPPGESGVPGARGVHDGD